MFESFPLWLNGFIYLVAAGLIWTAGYYLEKNATVISERTILGQAFTGVLLLSVTTSLPEVATVVTATVFLDNPTLAVHNLLGGVALQIAILIAADKVNKEDGALTFFSPHFVLLIEGVGVIILLQLVIAGVTVDGMPSIGNVSIWGILIFLTYLGILYLTYHEEDKARWKPTDENIPEEASGSASKGETNSGDENSDDEQKNRQPIKKVWLLFAGASIVVLIAGWGAAQSADVLAKQTGLGDAFLGATLLALATSLPELSTTTTASRDKQFSMAVSNIFGSNSFNVSLIFLVELLYFSDTVIKLAKSSVVLIASAGAIMICIYLWGLMERKDRTFFGIGWDSAACLFIYLGAMTVLFFMR